VSEKPPSPFKTWEQCRDYYALEALFLGQLYEARGTKGSKNRYKEAAECAVAANRLCAEPYPEEDLP